MRTLCRKNSKEKKNLLMEWDFEIVAPMNGNFQDYWRFNTYEI